MTKRVVDFDQYRAERDEEAVDFIIGGKTYALPPALPASIAVDTIRMKADLDDEADIPLEEFDAFGSSVFGPTIWEALLREHRITVDEIGPLIEKVLEQYVGDVEDPKAEGDPEQPPTSETEEPASA